jgi:EAL domain-containing protein (putative c-di-GMP-specific phosphodiesterase class I)
VPSDSTGYASLSLLKRYPITRLKIDRSFVRDLSSDDDDAAIVELVLTLGERFGLEVIAEGIETVEQEARLAALGCPEGQGYLFGRPMPASSFEGLLRSRTRGNAKAMVA